MAINDDKAQVLAEHCSELLEAFAPFVSVRDQFPQSMKLIQPKMDGFAPITVTVTKAQFQAALAAIAKVEGC